MTGDGLIRHASRTGFSETLALLVEAIEARGLTVFARIDHGEAARKAGLELRDTTLLVFGNPRGGTPLMAANQEAGIDLPLHLLVWTDADGRTWVTYTAPAWIARRHGLGEDVAPALSALSAALAAIAQAPAFG